MTTDDEIPPRPPGRPVRKLADAFSEMRSGHVCRECPKYSTKTRWCPVKATCRPPDALACQYGLSLLEGFRLTYPKKKPSRQEGVTI